MGVLARSFYSQTVDHEPYNGRDGQGGPSYGTKTTGVSARISRGGEFEVEQDGATHLVDAICYIPSTASVTPRSKDRITGPDNTTYIVAADNEGIARDGSVDHYKLGLLED